MIQWGVLMSGVNFVHEGESDKEEMFSTGKGMNGSSIEINVSAPAFK